MSTPDYGSLPTPRKTRPINRGALRTAEPERVLNCLLSDWDPTLAVVLDFVRGT